MYTVYAPKADLEAAQQSYAKEEDYEVKKLSLVFFLSLLGKRVHCSHGPLYMRGVLKHTYTSSGDAAIEYYGFTYGKYDDASAHSVSFSFNNVRMITISQREGEKHPTIYIYFKY